MVYSADAGEYGERTDRHEDRALSSEQPFQKFFPFFLEVGGLGRALHETFDALFGLFLNLFLGFSRQSSGIQCK